MHIYLIRFERVASTQDWVKAWARLGAREGLAVQAREQTAGRGRLQREWWSPYGNGLYLSVLLRAPIPLQQAGQLTMLASLAAIDACEEIAGIKPRPKWPNDLLLDGRKLAGILTELEHEDDRLSYAVIGLGLNVSTNFSDTGLQTSAASLSQTAAHPPDIDALRASYLRHLAASYRRFLAGENPHAAWRRRLEPLGRQVRVVRPGQDDLSGRATDVSPEGALLVQDDDGIVHTIWAGDVTPIPPD